MPDDQRQAHRGQVLRFLMAEVNSGDWQLILPQGRGHETYLAHCDALDCFVKLDARVELYQALAAAGLTPPVLAAGRLADGRVILAQQFVRGRNPAGSDFALYARQFAETLAAVHRSRRLKQLLAPVPSEAYKDLALSAARRVERKWRIYRALAPECAAEVEAGLKTLRERAGRLSGSGCAASHNDICNANWLVTEDGRVYLIDLEAMRLDDPALDLGAFLWWYFPPDRRAGFLRAAGYEDNQALRERMRLRLALHCLDILLPRASSFDRFQAEYFNESLVDFRAALAGEENPQGYPGW